MTGAAQLKAEIAAGALLFKVPSAARPETRRLRLLANSEKFAFVTIETDGEVKLQNALKAAVKIDLGGIQPYALKP